MNDDEHAENAVSWLISEGFIEDFKRDKGLLTSSTTSTQHRMPLDCAPTADNDNDMFGRGIRKKKARSYNEEDDGDDPSLSGSDGLLDDGGATPTQEWVCCGICDLWRKLPPDVYSSQLPAAWNCSMNTWSDSSRNSCNAPQEEESDDEDEGADNMDADDESYTLKKAPKKKKSGGNSKMEVKSNSDKKKRGRKKK